MNDRTTTQMSRRGLLGIAGMGLAATVVTGSASGAAPPAAVVSNRRKLGSLEVSTRFAPGDIRGDEGRFSPADLPHNLALVALAQSWAERKQATSAQIALAWLIAQKPWIVPIPGTTQMAHMVENTGAAQVRFSPSELAELNQAVRAVQVQGSRLPDAVLAYSGVEAPARR